ncbi:CoA transferase [Clostridium botulinum]|uniref:Carnitine dehydratase n=1 Tax=Clostridium botulinum C/D str. DC5 TaxID=1443128 RepID=A0A0A0I8A3_CLOBO|nr:CoA transferase [Clostridium botulinum]KGM97112.1 carnitine dehydratase [Clostridium botulinum C/D str. DC5]KOC53534.1 carnitine dehydratase [Clostridium botulinum]KOC57908.1 carnitine dehydratase [Clostridium botulinum]MCD3234214.1 CoA transferase [Clostridium botulinum D/C]MCD3240111.1 CoA transferase [Clostridium botulinum D/C]
MKNDKKPLTGVRVVELSTFVAAPTCAKVLADWGADVIKVEAPFGDSARIAGAIFKMPITEEENPLFENVNSNKRGVCLNIKSKEGKEALYKLIENADVFITNNRTESLKRNGLSYEQLSEKFPNIIFAQILGYGEKGKDKDKPGFDYTAYYARGGIMGTLMEKDTSPLNPAAGFGDHQAGMFLAAGVCAALYKKKCTGKGDKVTVGLFHTGLFGMATMIPSAQYGNNWPTSRKKPNSPLMNAYKCKDGKWVQIAIIEYDKYFSKFCRVIEREDLINNYEFNTLSAISSHTEDMVEIVENQFAKKSLEEWTKILNDADLPFEKIQLWEDILEDEQAWDNNYLRKIKYENGHEGILVNTPVKFEQMGLQGFKKAPKIGEHTKEVLLEMGYSEEQIRKIKDDKDIK